LGALGENTISVVAIVSVVATAFVLLSPGSLILLRRKFDQICDGLE
jgi:hypothetical protein